jgi:ketosteroid isomerase-like protein
MAHPNDELIQRFYAAFARRDGDEMAGCYSPDAHFSDPVFRDLHDGEPGAMWRMLAKGSTDLSIELLEHEADDDSGSARWLAHYTFGQTGRHVDNDVRARYRFRDGLIVEHRDDFSFYRWARQALGPTGLLLGWTPIVKGSVRKQARGRLDEFMTSERGPA